MSLKIPDSGTQTSIKCPRTQKSAPAGPSDDENQGIPR